jgi:hypothetical protein
MSYGKIETLLCVTPCGRITVGAGTAKKKKDGRRGRKK